MCTIATDLIPVEALALGLPGPGEHGQQEGEQVRPETEQEAEQERDHYHEDNDAQASRLGVNLEQKYWSLLITNAKPFALKHCLNSSSEPSLQ